MLKILASQPHTTTNKLDDSRGIDGGDTTGGGADVDDFGFESNEKSSKSKNKKSAKSRKSTIPANSRATKKLKFLTSNTKEAFNL